MYKNIVKLIILIFMLIGLPLIGIIISGHDISNYLEFPPKTHYVAHAPFSFPVFLGLGLLIFVIFLPFIYRSGIFIIARSDTNTKKETCFPWWGYAGLITGLVSWILAWTRFGWFSSLQLHTFLPLWLSYILIVNALTKRRKGSCLMTKKPRSFLSLFPVSISFWWFFEYLNRFVQNWYYVEMSRFTSLEYFLLASASFSTVLPAVLSTREYLLSFPFFEKAFGTYVRLNPKSPKLLACIFFIISGIGLACIGSFPNYLFPLLWASPFIIVVSLQAMANEKHILSDLSEGRWAVVFASAVSALICGFFWEMWNYFSHAKWIYSIPFVQQFQLFEMPLLGYAGYLPFGFGCAVIGDIIMSAFSSDQKK
jgi:hypothetical protein